MYGWAWRRLRILVLHEEHFTCRRCGGPADQVDHIVPVSEWPAGELVRSNCQAMCRRCNVAKENERRAERAMVDVTVGQRRSW